MRIILAVPAPGEARLRREATVAGHDVVAAAGDDDALIASAQRDGADLALVWAAPRFLSYGALAECDARGVRVVAVASNDAERRYARGVGLHEVIDADAGWGSVEAVLGGAGTRAATEQGRGSVIAVWGPAGSPGRTSVAIGVAAEIVAAGFTVALCDVDTHSASIAPALGMMDEAPGFAAACRLAGADSLSRAELERIGQRHRGDGGAFWVLTGIGQPSRWPELSADRVAGVIEECRRWVDYVVLDTGFSLESDDEIASDVFSPRRNAATLTAVREADHIVAVGAADPVGLSRLLRAHGGLLDLAATDSITVVANKVRASAIGLNPHGQVQQTLARFGGIDSPVLVPWDQNAFDAAVLSGRTLGEVAPRSAARQAIRGLAVDRLLPAGSVVSRRARGARRARKRRVTE